VPSVLKVLQDDPDIAELLRQGLVQPEQLKDQAYVASLRMNLLKNRSEGRPANLRGRVRASKAPVFKRQVESRRTRTPILQACEACGTVYFRTVK
jgi:hypothetical protein